MERETARFGGTAEDAEAGRDILVTFVAQIHRGNVNGVRSKIESLGQIERMELARLLQETHQLANMPEGKKLLDLLVGKKVQEGRRAQHKYKYIDAQVGRDVLLKLISQIHRGKVNDARSKIESIGRLERMELARLLQDTFKLTKFLEESKKLLDLLESKNVAAELDFLEEEGFLDSHPHFYELNKDKVSTFKYGRTVLFGMNKAYQVRQTTITHQGKKHILPGDWYITITKKLLIVTCQGWVFPKRLPIIVKPWKITDRDKAISSYGVTTIRFEDCDALKWELGIIPGAGTSAGAILTAYDIAGKESMDFNMEGWVKV